MKKLFTLIIAVLFFHGHSYSQDCLSSTATTTLEINNVKANLGHSGTIWNDRGYIAPASSPVEVSSLFTGAFWMGGVDPGGNLKLAATTYSTNGAADFYPGPLQSGLGTTDINTCSNFDRHWEINRLDLLAFIEDLTDGTIENEHPSIYAWPGKNNPHSLEFNGFELPDEDLAPFFDNNSDGIYNPDDGDFPEVKGDKAIWWVFNDRGNIHSESMGDVIQAEVQVLAYAFNRPNDEHINNTTFYDFKVINKAVESIDSLSVGFFMDADLGCYTDDYIGCIPEENLAFAYNADATDGDNGCACQGGLNTYCESIPVIGLKLIKGPDQYVGGPEVGITNFAAYYNASVNNPPLPNDPNTAQEYYNLLTGSWPDGTPFTQGGTGYGGTEPTNFLFSDNPSDTTGWSMCQENLTHGDTRFIVNSSGLRLEPGESLDFSYALLWVPDVAHPCPDMSSLIEAGQAAEDLFNEVTAVEEFLLPEGTVKVFPNPMSKSTNLVISDNQYTIKDLSLFDATGRRVRYYSQLDVQSIEIERNNLEAGIYFYNVITSEGLSATGKLIIQ